MAYVGFFDKSVRWLQTAGWADCVPALSIQVEKPPVRGFFSDRLVGRNLWNSLTGVVRKWAGEPIFCLWDKSRHGLAGDTGLSRNQPGASRTVN